MAASNESTLQRTFSVVEYLSREKRKVPLQELAGALCLTSAAAHRLLNGLMELGYVDQDENKRYYLTYKVYKVAGKSLNRDNFLQDMIPYMNYFAMRYGCEVGLTVFADDTIIHVLNVGRNINLGKDCLRPGQVFPLYCSAPGKAFLAQMAPDALSRWIEESALLPHTIRTIIDKQQLYQEIRRTRDQGYGVSEGELYDIVYAVAFPIHDQSGAAIGTFNVRMLPETYQENMCRTFTEDVQRALENFGL